MLSNRTPPCGGSQASPCFDYRPNSYEPKDFIIRRSTAGEIHPIMKIEVNAVKSQPMDSPDDSIGSKASLAISTSLPGPDFVRYYPVHRLIAWQPQGTLDDLMLDQIADWLGDTEKVFPPFKRFVDFSQLTSVAVRTRHVFEFARKRAEQFPGVEPVQTALFADDWVCHAIARLYESLMEDTLIEARAFKDLARAAEWLGIPVDVLTLKDEPVAPNRKRV